MWELASVSTILGDVDSRVTLKQPSLNDTFIERVYRMRKNIFSLRWSVWVAIKIKPFPFNFFSCSKGKQSPQRVLICKFALNYSILLTFSVRMEWDSKFLVCAQECLGRNKDHARSNNISHVPKGQAKPQKGGGFWFSWKHLRFIDFFIEPVYGMRKQVSKGQ